LLPDEFDWVLAAGRYTTQENTPWSRGRSGASVNGIGQLISCHIFTRWKPKAGWLELDTDHRWARYSRSGYDIDDVG